MKKSGEVGGQRKIVGASSAVADERPEQLFTPSQDGCSGRQSGSEHKSQARQNLNAGPEEFLSKPLKFHIY